MSLLSSSFFRSSRILSASNSMWMLRNCVVATMCMYCSGQQFPCRNHQLSLTKEADLWRIYSLELNSKGHLMCKQHHKTSRSCVRPVSTLYVIAIFLDSAPPWFMYRLSATSFYDPHLLYMKLGKTQPHSATLKLFHASFIHYGRCHTCMYLKSRKITTKKHNYSRTKTTTRVLVK